MFTFTRAGIKAKGISIILNTSAPERLLQDVAGLQAAAKRVPLEILLGPLVPEEKRSVFTRDAQAVRGKSITFITSTHQKSTKTAQSKENVLEQASHDDILLCGDDASLAPTLVDALSNRTDAIHEDAVSISLLTLHIDPYTKLSRIVSKNRPTLYTRLKHIFASRTHRLTDPYARTLLFDRRDVAGTFSQPYKNLADFAKQNPQLSIYEIPSVVEDASHAATQSKSPKKKRARATTTTPANPAETIAAAPIEKETHPIRISRLLLIAAISTLTYAFLTEAKISVITILTLSGILLLIQASVELYRMVYAFRKPSAVDGLQFPDVPDTEKDLQRFCILVPARHEADVLAGTLQQLAHQTYMQAEDAQPNGQRHVDIIAVICQDDTETLETAQGVADTHERVSIITYPLKDDEKPSKPKQLNYAFAELRSRDYTVYGIIDAEDTVHPGLLDKINTAFSASHADVVQGGVQLMNHDTSWYSLHNVLEYYRWFNSGMTFHADMGFIPLGGNTVFVSNTLLQATDGWPDTLTEDCSLGVLLSARYDAHVSVHYEPAYATREETPDSLRGLFMQRVRWNQGFFHEWKKNIWSELPTLKQRLLADYVLIGPVLMATVSVILVLSLVAALTVSAPVGIVMIMYLSLIPNILMIVVNCMYLHDFGKAFDRKIRIHHYILLVTTQLLYQAVLNAASFWALVREFRGDNTWHKTSHKGLHRVQQNLQEEGA